MTNKDYNYSLYWDITLKEKEDGYLPFCRVDPLVCTGTVQQVIQGIASDPVVIYTSGRRQGHVGDASHVCDTSGMRQGTPEAGLDC